MITSEELRDAFHYLYPDELPELKRLAKLLPPNPYIVNIGAGSGTSSLAFMEARPDCTLYTIDIENNDSPLGSLFSERAVFKEAGIDHLMMDRWFQVHEDSKVVGTRWQSQPGGKQFDLVFVDGDHSYEGCWGDIEAWLPIIKTGGFLVIHDYNKQMLEPNAIGPHPEPHRGVNMAVDALINLGFEPFSQVDSLISFKILDGDLEYFGKELVDGWVENLDGVETLGDDDALGPAQHA